MKQALIAISALAIVGGAEGQHFKYFAHECNIASLEYEKQKHLRRFLATRSEKSYDEIIDLNEHIVYCKSQGRNQDNESYTRTHPPTNETKKKCKLVAHNTYECN